MSMTRYSTPNIQTIIGTSEIDIELDVAKDLKEKIREQIINLENILEEIKNDTNGVKEYWESSTSNSVYENFEEMYKGFSSIIEGFKKTYNYLVYIINYCIEVDTKIARDAEEKLDA